MNHPMISVVMPVYNGEKYLHEAIDSVLNQTYADFEFIILNDGSTDKTEEIILSYDDPRIRYIKNETNLKIVKTLNKGIALAKGKYIARMDADDISLPERFEKQIGFMENNLDIDVCGTWVQTFGVENQLIKYPISHDEIKTFMLFNSPLAHPTVMIRRTFFDDVQYTETYDKAEDYYLWYKTIESQRFHNLPICLLLYRVHESMTTIQSYKQQVNRANIIRTFMLKKLNNSITQDDTRLHLAFVASEWNNSGLDETSRWIYKLLLSNEQSNFFDDYFLKKYIGEYWWQMFSQNTDKGLRIFISFIYSDLRKFTNLSKIMYVKFFFKCLVKYQFARK